MLGDSYKDALQALKEQAAIAAAMREPGDKKAMRVALAEAQRRISENAAEAKIISYLIRHANDEKVTVETVTELWVSQELSFAE